MMRSHQIETTNIGKRISKILMASLCIIKSLEGDKLQQLKIKVNQEMDLRLLLDSETSSKKKKVNT